MSHFIFLGLNFENNRFYMVKMQQKSISRSNAGSIVVQDLQGLFTEYVCLRIKRNRSSLNDNLNLESMGEPRQN